ncbi:MAG: hypothetical protein JSV50_08365 [Desulfobacteraceae bacterium]|nr:MAG: hypothetical protein JSV50_08365 [Desulfobacteraceae bacterium]
MDENPGSIPLTAGHDGILTIKAVPITEFYLDGSDKEVPIEIKQKSNYYPVKISGTCINVNREIGCRLTWLAPGRDLSGATIINEVEHHQKLRLIPKDKTETTGETTFVVKDNKDKDPYLDVFLCRLIEPTKIGYQITPDMPHSEAIRLSGDESNLTWRESIDIQFALKKMRSGQEEWDDFSDHSLPVTIGSTVRISVQNDRFYDERLAELTLFEFEDNSEESKDDPEYKETHSWVMGGQRTPREESHVIDWRIGCKNISGYAEFKYFGEKEKDNAFEFAYRLTLTQLWDKQNRAHRPIEVTRAYVFSTPKPELTSFSLKNEGSEIIAEGIFSRFAEDLEFIVDIDLRIAWAERGEDKKGQPTKIQRDERFDKFLNEKSWVDPYAAISDEEKPPTALITVSRSPVVVKGGRFKANLFDLKHLDEESERFLSSVYGHDPSIHAVLSFPTSTAFKTKQIKKVRKKEMVKTPVPFEGLVVYDEKVFTPYPESDSKANSYGVCSNRIKYRGKKGSSINK